MAKMKKFDYDSENDILYLRKYGKIKGSTEVEGFEDIVIDFSFNDVPIGLEIMNINKNFNIPKSFLNNLEMAGFSIQKRGNSMLILVVMKISAKCQQRVTIPVSMK